MIKYLKIVSLGGSNKYRIMDSLNYTREEKHENDHLWCQLAMVQFSAYSFFFEVMPIKPYKLNDTNTRPKSWRITEISAL